jgi:betaine-aldehyde dehydrogenase
MADLYIGGTWTSAREKGTREIRCPADGSLVGVVDEAGGKDTVEAIAAARRAFDEGPWPGTPPNERGDLLLRVADLLARDKDDSPAPSPSTPANGWWRASTTSTTSSTASATSAGSSRARPAGSSTPGNAEGVDSRVVYEPVGVCALITPWNYPLLQTAWKVAPASPPATPSSSSRAS